MFDKLHLEFFTAFEEIELDFSPGINIIIGENSTGKTHLLKFLYCVQTALQPKASDLNDKLANVFLPTGRDIDRLVTRVSGQRRCRFTAHSGKSKIEGGFTNRKRANFQFSARNVSAGTPIYIPVKEMLANAPGFRSVYSQFDLHFEEVYFDIIDKAFIPVLRGKPDADRAGLMRDLEKAIEGRVTTKDETFYLKSKSGELELTLVSEGYRKLALLWLLIRNGSLLDGSVLYWDEPETNLNPKVMPALIGILMKLSELGVQIFLATHSYDFLKELSLQATERKSAPSMQFISLYRDAAGKVAQETSDRMEALEHNAIAEQQDALFRRDVRRSIG